METSWCPSSSWIVRMSYPPSSKCVATLCLIVQVMPPHPAGHRIDVGSRRGEDPLPRPLTCRVRVLSVQGIRKLDPPRPCGDVARVLRANTIEMGAKWIHHLLRQHRDPILPSLAVAHDNLEPLEVQVIRPQAYALQQPEPSAIEKRRHERRHARHPVEHRPNFGLRQYHGHPLRPLRAREFAWPGERDQEHAHVEEEQRREGLVLRGGADVLRVAEVRKERLDLGRAEL